MLPTEIRHIFSVAPMLDWTDRHCRYFHRLISRRALLYTEMITTGAILHGDAYRYLQFSLAEQPVALQLGGSDPKALAQCARMGEDYGYNEINLNVGCPSNRVQNGRFGACLMAEPALVASCVAAMQVQVNIPITVKTRIGIDHQDSYEHLWTFINTIAAAGCNTFIIHARKAWLTGLSPKENREIPPLRYDIAEQLVRDFPRLHIVLNGGITNLDSAKTHLALFSGVMLGRSVYHNPYLLAEVDRLFYQETQAPLSREEIMRDYISYVKEQLHSGVPLGILTRPIFGLYQGLPGARAWRRFLSENVHLPSATEDILRIAEKSMQKEV